MMDRASWCYICGLVKAQWDRLLDQHDIVALTRAESAEDRQSRLRGSLLFAEGVDDFVDMDIVEERFAELATAIARSGPDERIADLLLDRRDWQAFRAFAKDRIKAALDGREPEPSPADDRRAAAFEACWNERNEDPRWGPFAAAARLILADVPREGDFRGWLDLLCDAQEAAALVATARRFESEMLERWIVTWVRLRAALALIRVRLTGWDAAPFLREWQRAGFDDRLLADIAVGQGNEWGPILGKLGLHAGEDFSGRDTPRLARLIDEHLGELTREADGVPFGPEPVFAFLWALRREATNLSLALSAATYDIPEERLSAELRAAHG